MLPDRLSKRRLPAHSTTLTVLYLLFAITLSAMLISHLAGVHQFAGWNVLAELDRISVTIGRFTAGPFNLSQSAESALFFKKFVGSAPLITPLHYLAFGTVVIAAVLALAAVVSTLKKFWFYIGSSLFALFLVSLKSESLLLFGSNEKIGLILILIAYLTCLYYFNSLRPDRQWLGRWLTLVALTAAIAAFFFFASDIGSPLFYLTTSLAGPALILSMVFIFSVSHEVVAGFARLLFGTGTGTIRNGMTHFIVISTVYLSNLMLAYLHETRVIDWDMLYINVFLLLAISATLGIWGFRHRENQYENILRFLPGGAIVYFSLAIITFATITHFYTTGNDAGLEVFRDAIIYGHLAYGLIFVLYVLANFSGLLRSGQAIYKVIYKPANMPYFSFRFAGIMLVVALVLKANYKVPVYQYTASGYHAVADYHYLQGEIALAARYYREAADYARHNHKSHYILGIINEAEGNKERAVVHYKEAVKKWPGPQAYLNLIALYEQQNRFFDALFTAKEALAAFPDSYQILNQIGLLYSMTALPDSAVFYMDRAAKASNNMAVPSNIPALLAKGGFRISPDSVAKEYLLNDDPVTINNLIALSNSMQLNAGQAFVFKDSTLSTIDLALLNNVYLNKLHHPDTLDTTPLVALAGHQGNRAIRESVRYLECLHLYKNGNVNKAFRQLNWLANSSKKSAGSYFNNVGLWALEQGAPDVAVNYFRWAAEQGYEDALMHLAIALSENQNTRQAIEVWQQLYDRHEEPAGDVAARMLKVLSAAPKEIASGSDEDNYFFVRYRLGIGDSVLFDRLIAEIDDTDYKAEAILHRAQRLWDRNFSGRAIQCFARLAAMKITDPVLFEAIQFFELKMLAHQGNIRGLARKINQGVTFEHRHLEKAYFTALISQAGNDTTAAKQQYRYIGDRNPFYPEATIAAAAFIGTSQPFEAYDLLLSALELNPNSIKLLEAYIYQCGRVQQNTSAEIALKSLEKLVSKQEYEAVEKKYNRLSYEAANTW